MDRGFERSKRVLLTNKGQEFICMKKRSNKLIATIIGGIATSTIVVCAVLNKKEKNDSSYIPDNIKSKVSKAEPTFYEKYIKRGLDIIIAFTGILVLSPVMVVSAAMVFFEDPGNVIFKQKRVGIHKTYFKIHKLRSMKQNTGDIPTHLLGKEEQEQLILKTGRVFRKLSIDELPQLYDILRNRMSVVGPRPALWNQDDLIAEREKYGANDVKPGLTGWAQINGRDELPILDKAKLDGYYTEQLRKSNLSGFIIDCKCFLGTIFSVLSSKGVIEGGTGSINEEEVESKKIPMIAEIDVHIDFGTNKKILIAGSGSYIGEAFKEYIGQYPNYTVDSFDTKTDEWRQMDFSEYDVLYDVAGIAHIKETDKNRNLYYEVNRNLALEIARKAKEEGVKQFIYLSSMAVYGLKEGKIDIKTPVKPVDAYGRSKLEAEKLLWKLNDKKFIVSIIRPPMVYGENCKGNYQLLRKFAIMFQFFPQYNNERSMIYIDNLSSSIRGVIHNEKAGLYFPQNVDYMCTYDMVKEIVKQNGKSFKTTKLMNGLIKVVAKKIGLFQKIFGSLVYNKAMNVPDDWITVRSNEDCIRMTENGNHRISTNNAGKGKKILVMMSTYNGEKYIYPQIESIMNQKTNADIVLRIRDDGSKDNTCIEIERIMRRYPGKIELIRGENKGYNGSFFELINGASEYDYYSISDQDDIWLEDKLQMAINYMENGDNSIPLLYASTSYLVGDDLKPYGTTRKKEREFTLYNTIIQNICPGHTQVFNNALLSKIQGALDTSRIYVYDSWICNIAMLYGKILYDNNSYTYYRQHRDNQFGARKGSMGQLLASVKRSTIGDGFKYRNQIEYFVELNKEELEKQGYYEELLKFISIQSNASRCRYILRGKLYRQKTIETIAFYVSVFLGKY